ncbi:hypothetical protein [Lentzea roselyniae]|uniref:hypothetical protein n=1 Tax=Lentzea roselyniae TaxID=531940 RepID=UPI0031F76442
MLRYFISWLDDYLQSEGPPAIAKAVLGILSVAALPGAVFGSLLIKSAALLVALSPSRQSVSSCSPIAVRCGANSKNTGSWSAATARTSGARRSLPTR